LPHFELPDYHINWTQVKKLFSESTHTHDRRQHTAEYPAAVLERQRHEGIEKITKGSDVVILSDEVYEHLSIRQGQRVKVY
jgi:methionine aminotransferase